MSAHEPEHDAAGVSAPGSVVLDIGPGVGALVLHTPSDLEGAEIEISLAAAAARIHSQVRMRVTRGQSGASEHTAVSYAAVYPSLAAGSYTIWRDADTAAGVLTVSEARVTTWHWPSSGRPSALECP